MNATIQYLKHGKALCGAVFRSFVETFNWHTDFCRNLKGDGDIGTGRIVLDRSNPSYPVIRLKNASTGGGGEGGGEEGGEGGGEGVVKRVVTSVNSATGDVIIRGGSGIRISTSGNVVTISFEKDKEPDPAPSDPCAHPEGEPVPADADGDHGSGGGGGGLEGGGVPAGGDTHAGDGCTSDKCS